MKIIFIGTVFFSFKVLSQLINEGAIITGVVTKKTSGYNADFFDLSPLCLEHHIPVYYTKNINDEETIDWIKNRQPDIIYCFGISSLLKSELLKIPPMGVLGYHPALLPANRGRHPIIWAIALGLKQTGSTFFFMDDGADSGDIVSQETIEISTDDTSTTLYEKIINVALQQLSDLHRQLASGNFKRLPQDNTKANYWRKRSKKDGTIDFRMPAKNIRNLVRALLPPYPGAQIEFEGNELVVTHADIVDMGNVNDEPGKVLSIHSDKSFVVKCGEKAVKLKLANTNISIIKDTYIL